MRANNRLLALFSQDIPLFSVRKVNKALARDNRDAMTKMRPDLFLNNLPVNLPSRDIVIPAQSDIQIAFIVSQIEINFATVVQNVDLPYNISLNDVKL